MSVSIIPRNRFVEAFISLIHGEYEEYLKEVAKKAVRFIDY